MNNSKDLAYMYDFYNENQLIGQNDDIKYYIQQVKQNNVKNVLVIGAGTGRVAIPLEKYVKVSALDFDQQRLCVLKEKNDRINIIYSDIANYNDSKKYDMIIAPYSTLQFLHNKDLFPKILNNIAKLLKENGCLLFDVSESFNTKQESLNVELVNKFSKKYNENVKILYTSKRNDEYIEFIIKYICQTSNKTYLEKEKYFYYDAKFFSDVINNSLLKIINIDNGYGKKGFEHKHIYHCVLKGE